MVNKSQSDLLEVIFGVTQGPILELLLFNIFLADLFFTLGDADIENFADVSSWYVSWENLDKVTESLEQTSVSLFQWFEKNLLKVNVDIFLRAVMKE